MHELGTSVALVVGASGGIGRATMSLLLKRGATVLGTVRERTSSKSPTSREYLLLDVLNSHDVQRVTEHIDKTLGRLDVLVYCSGIAHIGRVEETSEEQWDRVFDVNAKGAFRLVSACLPLLRRSDSASVILVASQAGLQGQPLNSAYSASKGAVVTFTQSLARELGQERIRVNSVCPGDVLTDMCVESADRRASIRGHSRQDEFELMRASSLMGDLVSDLDVAEAICFLASDRAKRITGTSILITG